MEVHRGVLYVCATPIGNLEDISLRALEVLRGVDIIAAEDTRRTKKLLSYYKIRTPVTSYYEHNIKEKTPFLIQKLRAGEALALVSDAGMPVVSDPGAELVKVAGGEGIKVVPVPGPSAALAALSVSGFPGDRFVFEGFLPRKGSERKKRLEELAGEVRTLIFFESPHRIQKTITDLYEIFGEREAVVVREATKIYEEIIRDNLSGLKKHFEIKPPRGEITLVVSGKVSEGFKTTGMPEEWAAEVKRLVENGADKKEAIKLVSRLRGIPKKLVYAAVEGEKKKTEGT